MIDKLDAYNIVANLVPGAALLYALHYNGLPSPDPDQLGPFLVASFVMGVLTNRFGSLVIDPILRSKYIGFLQQKYYAEFVKVEKNDKKMETLVANAGLYRTFFTAGLFYFAFLIGINASTSYKIDAGAISTLGIVIGMCIFLFALRKEDGYIKTRIDSSKGQPTSESPPP